MMKRKILSLLSLLLFCLPLLRAGVPPVVSTDGNDTWYLVRFLQGGGVLQEAGDGKGVVTASATGAPGQLWRVTGSASQGYRLTSQSGLTLRCTQTSKSGLFEAASTTTGNTLFQWLETTASAFPGALIIAPKTNSAVFMNQWGGAGIGKPLGLWDNRSDVNQPLEFVTLSEWQRTAQIHPLIPYPRSVVNGEGRLSLSSLSWISCPDSVSLRYGQELCERLRLVSGVSLQAGLQGGAGLGVTLTRQDSLSHEAYTLTIDGSGVRVTAADSAGFFYALQTLRQLLPPAIYGTAPKPEADWSLPFVEVSDTPLLGYRGFMLDVARHFFSKEEVKRLLDVAASYKLNRFHFHLTDDQGWRVEIPEYPRLTQVGSVRAGSFTNAGGSTKFFDDTEYGRGMYFTLADLREIVAYAKARNIEILPEIDLPGHMVAAVASYPELSCDPTKEYSVRQDGGISKDVLNVGSDSVISFLKCVLGHIAEVFPYPYIHLGGDECPVDQWRNNADCQRRIREEGLSDVNGLQPWLVETLGLWLKSNYGKDVVAWDELLSHWPESNIVQPVIMAWNNLNKTAEAADKGFKSVTSPYQSVYLDFMQVPVAQADVNEGYQGGWGDGWVNTVEKVYNLNPLANLGGRESFLLGVQGNMWTETCCDSLQLEYQLFPRLLALSETGWMPAAEKQWGGFRSRLQSHAAVLDTWGMQYAKHCFDAPVLTDAEKALQEADAILSEAVPGGVGHPQDSVFLQLRNAAGVLRSAEDGEPQAAALAALQSALATYKSAPIVQPVEGKTYQIVSASTYYKAKYAGSTLYAKGSDLRFHYTPQTEPEELWRFTSLTGGGWILSNVLTGEKVQLPLSGGGNASLSETEGTPLRIDQATIASGRYSYVPGAVTLSAVAQYGTDTAVLLYANSTGLAGSGTNAALCYPGTWRVVEVSDFTSQLQGLARKARNILSTANAGAVGEPSPEALSFLEHSVAEPAEAAVAAGGVTEQTYNTCLQAYNTYLAMPRLSAIDALSEGKWYRIRNAYFTNYYACALATGMVAPRALAAGGDAYLWRLEKRNDGKVYIYNKAQDLATKSDAISEGAKIILSSEPYAWRIGQRTTDQGQTALSIEEASGTWSWYTNPSAWKDNIVFKPCTWGASIWQFEDTGLSTAIRPLLKGKKQKADRYFNLSGQRVSGPQKGVYVTSDGEKKLGR